MLKAEALQNAILTSASFSIIATDEKGIIQLFNVGAEQMLGYRAAEAIDRTRPSDMHDPAEVRARAMALVFITALRDHVGDIIGYLLIGSDNSVRHRVQQHLGEALVAA